MRIGACMLVTAILLTACAGPAPTPVKNKPSATWWNRWDNSPRAVTGLIQGQARVVSVDDALGTAVLDIGGRRVNGYWQTDTTYAQTSHPTDVVENGPLRTKVASYREAVTQQQAFPAVPGDLIGFTGMQTGRDILLRGVQVIAH